MIIGIPKEIRPSEYRVGLSPAGVKNLTDHGHTVYVEHHAGLGAGFSDQDYENAGARLAYQAQEVFGRADLLTKISRPLQEELEMMRDGAILGGLLQIPSTRPKKIDTMVAKKLSVVAYEQILLADNVRPVLQVSSQIGGRMAAQIAARLLENTHSGKGILLGGMPGVPPAEVVIIGAGTVGLCAVRAFSGLGAQITLLDHNLQNLRRAQNYNPHIVTLLCTPDKVARSVSYADVLVAAAAQPGERAPIIVTRTMVKQMKPRALIMDISIDQGGNVETSRPTSHENPTFMDEGVMHYCVPNIPGAVARTATHGFVNAALPFIVEIADKNIDAAMAQNTAIENAVAIHRGLPRTSVRQTLRGEK